LKKMEALLLLKYQAQGILTFEQIFYYHRLIVTNWMQWNNATEFGY
jgi:hypothetical protein